MIYHDMYNIYIYILNIFHFSEAVKDLMITEKKFINKHSLLCSQLNLFIKYIYHCVGVLDEFIFGHVVDFFRFFQQISQKILKS